VIKRTGNMNMVGAELAVSVMLSSLVRSGVCPGKQPCQLRLPQGHSGIGQTRSLACE
jgi:hypothetical protein